MYRRAFLRAIAAAPIAALAPWRPPAPATWTGFDVAAGKSYAGLIAYYNGRLVECVAFDPDVLVAQRLEVRRWERELEQQLELRRAAAAQLARIRRIEFLGVNPPVRVV